jgi:hypothetical protein
MNTQIKNIENVLASNKINFDLVSKKDNQFCIELNPNQNRLETYRILKNIDMFVSIETKGLCIFVTVKEEATEDVITNINTENGYIYFHCNSQPFSLDADNKDTLFSLITKNEPAAIYEEGEKDFDYDYFDYDLISDFPQYVEDYILELKGDWQEAGLDSIDESLFESDFFHAIKFENEYQFFLKDICKFDNENPATFLRITICTKTNEFVIDSEEPSTPFGSGLIELEEATQAFFDNINSSESYISVIAYELLINVTKEFKEKSSLILTF